MIEMADGGHSLIANHARVPNAMLSQEPVFFAVPSSLEDHEHVYHY